MDDPLETGKMEKSKEKEDMSTSEVKERKERFKRDQRYLLELFNFSCVLRGEVKYLEEIKKHIVQEYVDKGLVKLVIPTYDKKEIHIVTDEEWEEYQKLKEKDERLIGAGFM